MSMGLAAIAVASIRHFMGIARTLVCGATLLFAVSGSAKDSCLQIATKIIGSQSAVSSSDDIAKQIIAAAQAADSTYTSRASDLLAEAARLDIAKRGAAYAKMLRRNPADLDIRDFDHIVIGGGPEGTIAASNLTGRVLVINDTVEMGTFSKFGDTFHINSKEVEGLPSPNWMPSRRPMVQVSDIAKGYPPGRVIGNATEINLSLTNADFAIGDRAVGLSPIGDSGRVTVHMKNGEAFTGSNIHVFTGLGEEKLPFDETTLALIERERATGVSRIRFIDEMMTDSQKVARNGELPLERFAGKRIAVIGKGDGGAIVNQYLNGAGPAAGYAYKTVEEIQKNLPKKVFWIGQDAKTGGEYKTRTFDAYYNVGDMIDSKQITPVTGRGSKIEEITEGPDKGAFRVFFDDGEKDFVVADEVVVSAGYDQTQPSRLVQGLADQGGSGVEIRNVAGRPENFDRDVNIGKQVYVGGKPMNVYIGGPATGGLDTVGEAGGANSPRIQTLGSRTAELARVVSERVSKPRDCLTCGDAPTIKLIAEPKLRSLQIDMPITKPTIRFASEAERQLRIRFRLLHILQNFEVAGKGDVQIYIVPSKKHTVSIYTQNVDSKALDKIRKAFDRDPELLPLLASDSNQALKIQLSGSESFASVPTVEFVKRESVSTLNRKTNEVVASGLVPKISVLPVATNMDRIPEALLVNSIVFDDKTAQKQVRDVVARLGSSARKDLEKTATATIERVQQIRTRYPAVSNFVGADEARIINVVDRLERSGVSPEKIKAKLAEGAQCPTR